MTGALSPMPVPAQKQLKYTAGIANASVTESVSFVNQARKVLPLTLHDFFFHPFFDAFP